MPGSRTGARRSRPRAPGGRGAEQPDHRPVEGRQAFRRRRPGAERRRPAQQPLLERALVLVEQGYRDRADIGIAAVERPLADARSARDRLHRYVAPPAPRTAARPPPARGSGCAPHRRVPWRADAPHREFRSLIGRSVRLSLQSSGRSVHRTGSTMEPSHYRSCSSSEACSRCRPRPTSSSPQRWRARSAPHTAAGHRRRAAVAARRAGWVTRRVRPARRGGALGAHRRAGQRPLHHLKVLLFPRLGALRHGGGSGSPLCQMFASLASTASAGWASSTTRSGHRSSPAPLRC